MEFERISRQSSAEIESNYADRNFGSSSVDQLSAELENMRAQEKISDAEIPALFDKINKKIIFEAGNVSEDDLFKLLYEKKIQLLGRIIERMKATAGDRGSFEVLESALKLLATDSSQGNDEGSNRPYFDVRLKKIYMGPEATKMLTNPDILIALLAAKGSSGAANDLHHEFIHSHQIRIAQSSKSRLLEALNIFGDKNILLKEVQALIGADRKGNGKRIGMRELYEELCSDSYGLISTEEDMLRFKAAASEIKQLYALGFSDEEIGELVSRARWDKGIGKYDTFESEIGRVAHDEGLSEIELTELVKADELKTYLRIEKTKIAAKGIIEDFLK
ncbi:MAG: hypothetical protein WCT26_02870 [Candidatus Buchananbacteria bacterium]|jgi:hypothetical protein